MNKILMHGKYFLFVLLINNAYIWSMNDKIIDVNIDTLDDFLNDSNLLDMWNEIEKLSESSKRPIGEVVTESQNPPRSKKIKVEEKSEQHVICALCSGTVEGDIVVHQLFFCKNWEKSKLQLPYYDTVNYECSRCNVKITKKAFGLHAFSCKKCPIFEVFYCKECDRFFSYAHVFYSHIKKEKATCKFNNTNVCFVCNDKEAFHGIKNVREHIQAKHDPKTVEKLFYSKNIDKIKDRFEIHLQIQNKSW